MVVKSAVALALAAGAAPQFAMLPAQVSPGSHVVVMVRARGSCTLAIRYKNGRAQRLGTAYPRRGVDGWNWGVPGDAPVGPVRVSVVCPAGGRAVRTVTVAAWQ